MEVRVSLPGPNEETQGYVSGLSRAYSRFFLSFFCSGLVPGQWATWVDLVMVLPRMVRKLPFTAFATETGRLPLGIWPYSYNTCDVGTFPNQTYVNGSGPAAALQTEQGRSRYNFELSWLSGQKLS